MRSRIRTFVFLLYVIAFSSFLLDIAGLDVAGPLWSAILLLIDVGIIAVCASSLVKKTFNLNVLIIVLLTSVFTYLLHNYSIISHINGIREMVNIFLIFSFYEEVSGSPYRKLLDQKIEKFTKIFLIAQIPISLYQFLLYGAGDSVGGSLGKGNSGILTFVVVLMVYRVIKENYPRKGIKAYLNTIFLLPLFVNETKISFVLIPMMFFFMGKVRKFSTILVSALGAAGFFLLLNTFYSDRGRTMDNPFEQIFSQDYLDNYLLGAETSKKGDIQIDVPRFTKIVIATQLLSRDITEAMFGTQVGAFKGGKVVEKSEFSKNYFWLLLGSRPYLFYLMITGGWILVITMIFFFCKKIFRGFGLTPDKQLAYLCGIFLLVIMFYNDSPRNQFFIMMFAYYLTISKGVTSRRPSGRSYALRNHGVVSKN